jgi:DNA-binding CsgD family transcriptional regulator
MLSEPTLRTLSQALVELHRPGTHSDFPNRLFACLRTCFSCDFYSYDELTDNDASRIEIYPALEVKVDILGRWLNQRPNIGGVYKHNGSLRILHFSAPTRWCRTELQDDLLRLLCQKHHLGLTTLEGRSRLNVSLSRSALSFSEEERRMLDLLRPHLAQVYKGSRLDSYLSEAVGIANVGFLVADRAGKIRYATGKARRLLKEYFCPDPQMTLPDRVQAWLTRKAQPRSLLSSIPDLTINFGHKTLAVQTTSKPEAPEYRLFLRENVESLDAAPLQKLGLTHREAEVLLWVSQGKSNAEIAIILASKVRTVAKHLERVFAKLMVENRTAAAHAALAALSCSA